MQGRISNLRHGAALHPLPAGQAALARLLRDPDVPAALGPEWGDLLRSMTARDPGLRPYAHDVALQLRVFADDHVEPAADAQRRGALAGGVQDHLLQDVLPHDSGSSDVSTGGVSTGGLITGGILTGNIRIPEPPGRAPSIS